MSSGGPLGRHAPERTARSSAVLDEACRRIRPVLFAPGALAIGLALLAAAQPDERIAALASSGTMIGLALATLGATRLRPAGKADRGSRRARIMLLTAALFGTCWGVLPVLLFASASSDGRLLVVAASAIVLCCGHRLVPAKASAFAFLAPVYLGLALGLARAATFDAYGFALFALLVGAVQARWVREGAESFLSFHTAEHRAHQLAETLDGLLLHTEEGLEDWLWETDKIGRLRQVSPRFAAASGLPLSDLEGARLVKLLGGSDRSVGEGTRAVCTSLVQRRPFRNRVVELPIGDKTRSWRMSGVPIRDAHGAFCGFRGIACDLTAARAKEQRVTFLANHDSLTGLANRTCFATQAGAGCAASEKDGRWRALVSVDIDNFKIVNDRFGYAAGDRMLQSVAERLAKTAPPEALVARLGGDEFAIWLDPAPPAKFESLAAKIVDTFNEPFDVDGESVTIGVSIGIAHAPKHGTSFDMLLRRADLARYRAITSGQNKVCVFLDADEQAPLERRRLDEDMKLALARREFVLHYQPLVDLTTGEVAGFEALIRWNSATRGLVSPGDFIPAAEASGFIVAIDQWVMRQACRDAATWPDPVRVAVNVSPRQFRAPNFLETVWAALAESGLAPSRLEIEITEGVLLDETASARSTLTVLRGRGVRIALDDFGTGYSSLSYLVELPVDKIKIDQSFIRNFFERKQSELIVDSILNLAKKLDLTVIAEGVETANQAMALAARRCDQIQGYLVGRPRPAAAVPAMLEEAPRILGEAMPVGQSSPLALALVMKKQTERTLREAS